MHPTLQLVRNVESFTTKLMKNLNSGMHHELTSGMKCERHVAPWKSKHCGCSNQAVESAQDTGSV